MFEGRSQEEWFSILEKKEGVPTLKQVCAGFKEGRLVFHKEIAKLEQVEFLDEAAQAKIREIIDLLPLSGIDTSKFGGGKTEEFWNDKNWASLSEACLACGTCTFVCPTCQCYDIKDYNTGNGVQRYRCWDSCMYSDFTMMAHGNNRTSQMQRFRQRFMHKLVYFPANNNGMYSCVGCGRCIEKCPSALNIVKVIKAFENQGGEN